MPGDASDNVKPWTIRGIPPEERIAASEAAKLSDMTVDELHHAIRTPRGSRTMKQSFASAAKAPRRRAHSNVPKLHMVVGPCQLMALHRTETPRAAGELRLNEANCSPCVSKAAPKS